MNRRGFTKTLVAAAAAVVAPSTRALGASRPKHVPPSAAFDAEMESFMARRRIPGGALAVVRKGRIVYARGYGWADQTQRIPVRPSSLFRIASVSKPITAVAVLKLVEEKRLDLDAKAFPLLACTPLLEENQSIDERLDRITIRHLLQHTGGWDRDQSFDPMFRPRLIADKAGVPSPAGPEAVIRFMLGRRLDFDPGTRYAYSNFGYCVLGRIIEKISGQPYETFVRNRVLRPIGAHRARLGATLDGRQVAGEVHYYMREESLAKSVFPGTPEKVPWPYGGFHLEAMDAHGGWIASAIDLAHFAAALDNPAHSILLKPETYGTMSEPPAPPFSRKPGDQDNAYYGCGWMIRPVRDGKANYWHTGSLPGTATLLVRRWDGLSWAALFNQRSEDKKLPDSAIDSALHRAADSVTDWS